MPEVKLYALIAKAAGEKQINVEARTVSELIEAVRRRYPGKLDRYLDNAIVLVNGKNVKFMEGERTKIKRKDVVSIYPPLGGG